MSIGVTLRRNVRQVGDEPQNVHVGAAVFVCLGDREVSNMVIEPFPGPPKPTKGTVCPPNHCVLNRALVPTPVGPKHHLVTILRGVIRDGIEHQEPLPTSGFKRFNLKGGCPTSSPSCSVQPPRPRAKIQNGQRDSPGSRDPRGRA